MLLREYIHYTMWIYPCILESACAPESDRGGDGVPESGGGGVPESGGDGGVPESGGDGGVPKSGCSTQ